MELKNLRSSGLTDSQLEEIDETIAKAKVGSAYKYPWESLERDLVHNSHSKLTFLGYGSLVNLESAAVTFQKKSLEEYRPAIVFGARRIFNYEMPKKVGRYGPINGRFRAALNVRITNDIHDIVNGILFDISLDEIEAFRNREKGYDLVPVATIDWNDINVPPSLTYILRCPDKAVDSKQYTNNEIMPHWQYYLKCRNGALQVSKEFLDLWLKTTYLADGITPVSEWESTNLPELDTIDKSEAIS